MTTSSQRILVVDDDKGIVRLLRTYLERAGFQVLVAYDGETALHAVRRERPDLILLDLMLPDRDGWELTQLIRADTSVAPIPIVMLTARVEDTDKIVGLDLGADGYLTKPFNPQVVVAHVRAVLRRAVAGPSKPLLLQVRDLLMDLDRHEVSVAERRVDLTSTEFEFLRALMEHPDHVFTRLELIESALRYEYDGMERTVDSHIKNLRRKIEPAPQRPLYIETVYGIGYRLRGES
jgi:two-component system alkaline phosphatase synthesis response regulator PhoP